MKTKDLFIIKLAVITKIKPTNEPLTYNTSYRPIDKYLIAKYEHRSKEYITLDEHRYTDKCLFKNIGDCFIIEKIPFTVFFTYKRNIFRRTLIKYQKEFDNEWYKRIDTEDNKSERE